MGGLVLAVDIGGTTFSVAVAEPGGRILKVKTAPTDPAGGAAWMLEAVTAAGRDLVSRAPGPVTAGGVGFGGPVDFETQRVIQSTHVKGWRRVPISDILSDAFGIPVVTDNDANVGALGEFSFGAGRKARNLVYYTVSTGIGGGIVIAGRIYRGSNGNAGEVGHVPILAGGPLCACGNHGCLEALCSGPSIARRAREALSGGRRKTSLRSFDDLTAKEVFDAARDGDAVASEIVDETVTYLSMGVATTVNTFAPDAVVIGGGVSRAGRVLFEPLRRAVKERVMPVHRKSARVLQAKLGGRSVLLGAVALAQTKGREG